MKMTEGAGPALAKMQELIASQDLCVLATLGSQGLHTSLMTYVSSQEAERIYLITRKGTKKFANLVAHPQVSLLIDDRGEHGPEERSSTRALTVQGWARPLEASEAESIRDLFRAKFPYLARLVQDPGSVIIAVGMSSWQLLEGTEKSTVYNLAPVKP